MAVIVHQSNPLDIGERTVEVVSRSMSIRQWLDEHGIAEFKLPTICLVNGKPVLRKHWATTVLARNDVCVFLALPKGGGGGQGGSSPLRIVLTIVIIIIVALVTYGAGSYAAAAGLSAAAASAAGSLAGAAVGAGLTLLMNTFLPPPTPGGQEGNEVDPIYQVSAQNNAARLGSPIPVQYGRYLCYPEFVTTPYVYFVGRTQILEALLCIGQGGFDVHEIRIGDRLIGDIPEAQHEIIPPGGQPTLVPNEAYACLSVSNTMVESTNWVGPFSINPPGSRIDKVVANIAMPNGVYELDTKHGGYNRHGLQGEIQVRQIDDSGAPIGSWLTVFSGWFAAHSRGNVQPQARRYELTVPLGRYEIRLRRLSPASNDGRHIDTLMWVSAYGLNMSSHPDYGNVTLLGVRLKANETLSGLTSRKISVLATRKLPQHTASAGWSAPVASRNPVWAAADIVRATYGAGMSDAVLDLGNLEAAASWADTKGLTFDHRFMGTTTILQAASVVLAVMRAKPYLQSGKLRIAIDERKTVPVCAFASDNITKDSVKVSFALKDAYPYDSVEVEYVDGATWKPKTVLCSLGTAARPQHMRLPGVTDRAQAHHLGMYHLLVDRYRRVHVTFETGLEGHIPTLGDLVVVAYDTLDWAVSGKVYGLSGATLVLSEPVDFKGQSTGVIRLRAPDGRPTDPITVTPGDTPYQVVAADPSTLPTWLRPVMTTSSREPTGFLFGVVSSTSKLCKVLEIVPVNDLRIRVTAVVDDTTIYDQLDSLTPPPDTPAPPGLPSAARYLGQLIKTPLHLGRYAYRLSWVAAGYTGFVVYVTYDGSTWVPVGETTNTWFDLPATLFEGAALPINFKVVPLIDGAQDAAAAVTLTTVLPAKITPPTELWSTR